MVLEPRPIIDTRGLALPSLRTGGGYFASKGPHDVAWGDLLLALFTRLGARFMRRNVGSSFEDLLFEPNADGNIPLVDSIIRETAERDVPQIVIDTITLLLGNREASVKITFHLVDDDTVEARFIELQRDNQIKTIASRLRNPA